MAQKPPFPLILPVGGNNADVALLQSSMLQGVDRQLPHKAIEGCILISLKMNTEGNFQAEQALSEHHWENRRDKSPFLCFI